MDLVMRQSFFTADFNSDQYLSKCTQNSDLDSIRRQLIHYGNELQQQMGEILKSETESIVKLAEHLTNLNSKIEDLSLPICQLREEIRALYDLIKSSETNFKETLQDTKNHNTNTKSILLKLEIISTCLYIDNIINCTESDLSTDLMLLERIVNKYSFQRNYLTELNIISTEVESTVNDVEKKLLDLINNKFLHALQTNNRDVIEKCLRMYDNLSKHNEAEKTYQINIVRPVLSPILTEKELERNNHSIDAIYQQIIHFLDNKMNVLMEIVKDKPEFNSYNFILNSFWPEFDQQSREQLPYITAPGNPDLFQKRFISTWNLLCTIARKCNNDKLITENQSLKEHIKRFNLPVYFEIRFQQIANNFETNIAIENIYCNDNELNCKLNVTIVFWKCVQQCFHPDIFINHLSDQFVKLFLLLLARYLKWFEMILQENSFNTLDGEKFALSTLLDHKIIKNLIANEERNVDDTVFTILPTEIKPVVVKLFQSNLKSINKTSRIIQDYLVNNKIQFIINQLENVEAIPRLYRRTNRTAPKDPSSYVIEAIKPLIDLNTNIKYMFQHNLDVLLEEIITKCTLRYLEVVQKVLKSVCKTEESLRRLKSRNLSSLDESNPQSDTVTDEAKIREQINLDVNYFVEQLHGLKIASTFEILMKLKHEISKQ